MIAQENESESPHLRKPSSFICTFQIILRSMICALDIYILVISIILSTRKVNFAIAYIAVNPPFSI